MNKVSISVEKGKTVIRPLVTWRAIKPPLPKHHRKWLVIESMRK